MMSNISSIWVSVMMSGGENTAMLPKGRSRRPMSSQAASSLAPSIEMEHYREARRLDDARCERLRSRDVAL